MSFYIYLPKKNFFFNSHIRNKSNMRIYHTIVIKGIRNYRTKILNITQLNFFAIGKEVEIKVTGRD